jgi:uncharacterized membrane protein
MNRMPISLRKLALTAHVTTSVAWMGGVACFLALSIAGVMSQQHSTVQAAYVAMNLICWSVVVPLSVVSPISGFVQAIGTPWGLSKHYWVLVKLLITVPCTLGLLLHMLPTTQLAAAAMQGELVDESMRELRIQLVADSAVALVALSVVVALAIYKPRGLTRAGALASGQQVDRHRAPAWLVRLRRSALAVGLVFLAAHLAGKGIGGHGAQWHGPSISAYAR